MSLAKKKVKKVKKKIIKKAKKKVVPKVKKVIKAVTKKGKKAEKTPLKGTVKTEGKEGTGDHVEEVSEEELNNFFDDEYPEDSDYEHFPREENKAFQEGFEEE
jgi:hypothetical protein